VEQQHGTSAPETAGREPLRLTKLVRSDDGAYAVGFPWVGHAQDANRHIGESYGIDWQFTAPASPSILIQGERTARVGDWIVQIEGDEEWHPFDAYAVWDVFDHVWESGHGV